MTDLPLDGVRVLEIGGGVAAGLAGRWLAGYGADVVRTEDPLARLSPDEETWLLPGKRRIHVDDARLRDLALATDILIEDQKPGSLAARGLDILALRQQKPSLVAVSVTPFGQEGPYAGFEATNLTAWAMGGIMSFTGEPHREPLATGGSQAECLGAFNAFGAALTAYFGALVLGEGDWVDISLQECAAGMLELYGPGADYANMGPAPRRGNQVRAVWGIYPCADGYAGVCCLERQIPAFFQLLDNPVLSEERFSNLVSRAENDDELAAIVFSWFADRTKAEILALGPERRVPLGAVLTPADLLASESLAERGFFDQVPTASGTARLPGRPFPGFGWRAGHLHAPAADTAAVLGDWVGVTA